MKWRFVLKVDEVTLRQIMRTYGKPVRSPSEKHSARKTDSSSADGSEPTSIDREFETAGYDNNGTVRANPDQKKALIDFFQ
jgi:hypothetical protein